MLVRLAEQQHVGGRVDGTPPSRAGRPARPVSLRWLLGCLAFLGVSAAFGGIVLTLNPTGTWLQLPRSILQFSPFHDFFIPGLILGIVFGLGSFATLLALWFRPAWPLGAALTRFTGAHWAWSAAVAVGLGQVIWIITEMLMVRGAAPPCSALASSTRSPPAETDSSCGPCAG